MRNDSDKRYVKWGLTALAVIFVSIVLVVIFIDLPGFFAMLRALGAILAPLATGAIFAFLLNPLVRFVDSRLEPLLLRAFPRMKPRAARHAARAVGIVFALAFAALVLYAFFSMLLPQLYESVLGIVDHADEYYGIIETWGTNLIDDNPAIREYIDQLLDRLFEFVNNWVTTTFLSDVQKLLTTLTSSVYAIFKGAANLVVGLAASIYILWSKDAFQAQAKKLIVALFRPGQADYILKTGRGIYRVFNGFVLGKLVDSAIIGVLCYAGMALLKLPYPALISTIVGVTNIIPFFGPLIGAIPSTFLILLVNPLQAFYFVVFILVLQQIDGNIIGPRILGNTVGISGFWIIASITVATGLFGFAGMIFGVPVFAVLHSMICDWVNAALRRKERTTSTGAYYAIERVEDLAQDGPGSPEPDAPAPAPPAPPADT